MVIDPAGVFPEVRGYLDTATVGVPPIAAAAATRAAIDAWAVGTFDARDGDPFVERARAAFAALVGADPALYRYLWRSVLENDSTVRFRRRLEEAGFTDVRVRTGRGWHRGILHTYLASAPEAAA